MCNKISLFVLRHSFSGTHPNSVYNFACDVPFLKPVIMLCKYCCVSSHVKRDIEDEKVSNNTVTCYLIFLILYDTVFKDVLCHVPCLYCYCFLSWTLYEPGTRKSSIMSMTKIKLKFA